MKAQTKHINPPEEWEQKEIERELRRGTRTHARSRAASNISTQERQRERERKKVVRKERYTKVESNKKKENESIDPKQIRVAMHRSKQFRVL